MKLMARVGSALARLVRQADELAILRLSSCADTAAARQLLPFAFSGLGHCGGSIGCGGNRSSFVGFSNNPQGLPFNVKGLDDLANGQ